MSHFLKALNATSLSPEEKASLEKMHNALGNTPALREAVSHSFQVQIEKTATDAGLQLDQDLHIKKLVETYEGDVGALVATAEATAEAQVAHVKKSLRDFHPQLDAVMAAKIRSGLV